MLRSRYEKIEEIRQSYEEGYGITLQINDNLKNSFAWLTFEHAPFD